MNRIVEAFSKPTLLQTPIDHLIQGAVESLVIIVVMVVMAVIKVCIIDEIKARRGGR